MSQKRYLCQKVALVHLKTPPSYTQTLLPSAVKLGRDTALSSNQKSRITYPHKMDAFVATAPRCYILRISCTSETSIRAKEDGEVDEYSSAICANRIGKSK